MKLRVLVLGDSELFFLPEELEQADLEIKATCETEDEVWDKYAGRYRVSSHSLKMAGEASPDKYDAIIVMDNFGRGVPKARKIPASMQGRTMIVWDGPGQGQEREYAHMGFSRFGVDVSLGDEFDMLAFLKEVAAELASVAPSNHEAAR